ncbi:hypothetical protein D3C77_733600 [compost metagenome]
MLVEAIGVLHPAQATTECLLINACTFRFAGRARGVNDVGQVLRDAGLRQVLARVTCKFIVSVDHNAVHPCRHRYVRNR